MKLLDDLRAHMRASGSLLNNWSCVYVQHLLASNKQCVEFLESLGLKRESIRIYGKGYSTSQEVLQAYVADGYAIVDRPSDYQFDGPFDEEIIHATEIGLSAMLEMGSGQILVLDEGGI